MTHWYVNRRPLSTSPPLGNSELVAVNTETGEERILCPVINRFLALELIGRMPRTKTLADIPAWFAYTDAQVIPADWQEALLLLEMEEAL